jgi:hypothetical protein
MKATFRPTPAAPERRPGAGQPLAPAPGAPTRGARVSGALSLAGLLLAGCAAHDSGGPDPFVVRDPGLGAHGSAFPEDLLGAWIQVDPAEWDPVLMLFEPARVVAHGPEGRSFREARYGTDSMLVRDGARFEELYPILKQGQLLIRDLGQDLRLERLAETPPELVLHPLELGEPRLQTTERTEEIQVALDRRRAADQAVRERLSEFRTDELVSRMVQTDRENTAWLRELVQEIGWIDAERFGSDASNAAFLLVQHSGDLALMQAALPWVEADWKQGRVRGAEYALLYDRLSLALGRPQLYGSQLQSTGDGPLYLLPLSDPKEVEQRRAEVGLEPLADYLERFVEPGDPAPEVLRWPDFGEL